MQIIEPPVPTCCRHLSSGRQRLRKSYRTGHRCRGRWYRDSCPGRLSQLHRFRSHPTWETRRDSVGRSWWSSIAPSRCDYIHSVGIGRVDENRIQPPTVDLWIRLAAVLPMVFGRGAQGNPGGRAGCSDATRELLAVKLALCFGFLCHCPHQRKGGPAAEKLPGRSDPRLRPHVRVLRSSVSHCIKGERAGIDGVVRLRRSRRHPENWRGTR